MKLLSDQVRIEFQGPFSPVYAPLQTWRFWTESKGQVYSIIAKELLLLL